jgi:hypothetical protein
VLSSGAIDQDDPGWQASHKESSIDQKYKNGANGITSMVYAADPSALGRNCDCMATLAAMSLFFYGVLVRRRWYPTGRGLNLPRFQ